MAAVEPNILAFQNGDLLDAVANPPAVGWTPSALAVHLNRDDSNTGKTLRRLRDEGFLLDPPLSGLTEEGLRQLAAFQRARSDTPAADAPAARWPIDQVRPNPANRKVDLDSIADLAASIVGAGDILQPLILTPPDANGVRMILAGERRWRAASTLAAEITLDGLGIAGGLPFVEREATAAEALLITVIENSQRQDLSPWDDAQLLLQLQLATEWNATELARNIGRAGEGERSGVRDVQTKLKVAREASPAAIAAYLDNRSWDQLRNSVSQPRPQTLSEVLAESGPAVMAPPTPTPLEEAIDAADKGPMRAARFGVPEDFSCFAGGKFGNEAYAVAAEWIEPGSLETFALDHKTKGDHDFPRAQIQIARIKESDGWIEDSGYSLTNIAHHARLKGVHSANAMAFRSRAEALASAARRIRSSIGDNERNGVPADIEAWLRQVLGETPAPTGPHVVNGVDYGNATRANEARYAAGILQRPRPNGGSSPRRDEPPHEPVAPTRTPEQGLPFRTPETGSPPTPTRSGDEGLSAALQVLLDRLEPVVAALKGERVDGALHIDGGDADWMIRELDEASGWAEGAIAKASDVFEPLPVTTISAFSPGSPAVPIRKSITPDHIVCLEDGRLFKSLKRHLRTRYDLSPEEYRAKWGLPADYPMVAPNYAKAREDLARQMGLR